MIVAVECAESTNRALAELARADVERHRPRTPERRAAAALWAALVTTRTPDAARSALATFADPRTVVDARQLLGELSARVRVNGHPMTRARARVAHGTPKGGTHEA